MPCALNKGLEQFINQKNLKSVVVGGVNWCMWSYKCQNTELCRTARVGQTWHRQTFERFAYEVSALIQVGQSTSVQQSYSTYLFYINRDQKAKLLNCLSCKLEVL